MSSTFVSNVLNINLNTLPISFLDTFETAHISGIYKNTQVLELVSFILNFNLILEIMDIYHALTLILLGPEQFV